MECKEFIESMPSFIDGNMKLFDKNEFIEHMDNCNECKEEFTIRLLSTKGLKSLELSESFDLNKEINNYIKDVKDRVKRRIDIIKILIGFEILFITVCSGLILFFLM
ncbi:MAG: zf-HC2 domain-containing protein [Lachnospiraceae bacterium]|nr:zf-HC2 domain-containing protein [Lachnospiraceae bacterium]